MVRGKNMIREIALASAPNKQSAEYVDKSINEKEKLIDAFSNIPLSHMKAMMKMYEVLNDEMKAFVFKHSEYVEEMPKSRFNPSEGTYHFTGADFSEWMYEKEYKTGKAIDAFVREIQKDYE